MDSTFIDYKYSLDILRRINAYIEADVHLRDTFVYRGQNLLQMYQAQMFDDCKVWSQYRSTGALAPTSSLVLSIKMIVAELFTIGVSVVSVIFLILSRRKTVVFSGDKISGPYHNEFRINGLYEALHTTKEPYLEIIHTVSDRNTITNFFKRKRPVIYLEACDPFTFFAVSRAKRLWESQLAKKNFSNFNPDEIIFVKHTLIKYCTATIIARWRIQFFRLVFRLSGVTRLFAIDDTRHWGEVMCASNLSGVKTFGLQHGHITKYQTGWLAMTTLPEEIIRPLTYFVWSEYWKKECIRLGTYWKSDEIIVGGLKSLSKVVAKQSQDSIVVLIPYEHNAPKKEVLAYIQAMEACGNVRFIFKIRPDMTKEEQLISYGLVPMPVNVSVVSSEKALLPEISLVCGTYSTYLYDMVSLGIPVLMLETVIDYGEGMVASGIADAISLSDDVCAVLRKVAATSHGELVRRKTLLEGGGKIMMRDTLFDILESIA